MGWRILTCVGFLSAASLPWLVGGCANTGRKNQAHELPAAGGAGGSSSLPVGGGGAAASDCAAESALAKARLWRLTDQQYVSAVQQLFGVVVGPAVADHELHPAEYTNFSELAIVSAANAPRYQKAARDVARQAVAAQYESFMPCGDDESCAEQFVRNRIARAFGRRLESDEVERYLGLFRKGAARSPQDGVRLMIEATLQSPAFLYRSELGPATSGGPRGQVALTSYEIATSLALTFTNALPDDALWQDADTGALADPKVLAAHVRRLLDLPEAKATLSEVASYWLGVQRLWGAEKDLTKFPEFTPELKRDLYGSSLLFVQNLLEQGTVDDIVASSGMYLNESLATLYGVPGVTGNQLRLVEVEQPERRRGILSQPGVLAGYARPDRNDVVHRGLFAYTALACGDALAPPPPQAREVAETFPKDASERATAGLRAAQPACAECHDRFDSLGLLMERYDAIGRYRESDGAGPIDESAVLASFGPDLDGPAANLDELVAKLGEGRRLSDCAAQNLASLTLGRADLADDHSCALAEVKDALAATGKFRDFYRALATSPAFVLRDAE